jgi:hypothetical protein
MFIGLLVLSIASFGSAIAGFVWVLARRGQARRNMSRRRLVRSEGVSVTGELTFAEMKAALRAGKASEALGGILAVGGMLGLMLFGSLAVLAAIDNKIVGGMVVAICVFGVVRMIVRVVKA